MKTLHLIRDEQDLDEALKEIDTLLESEPRTPAYERLQVLSLFVEKFEEERFPERLPSPVDAIKFRMEQMAWTAKDLEPFIGTRTRVWEVLAGKRSLTLPMIGRLVGQAGIPAASLINGMDWKKGPEATPKRSRAPHRPGQRAFRRARA